MLLVNKLIYYRAFKADQQDIMNTEVTRKFGVLSQYSVSRVPELKSGHSVFGSHSVTIICFPPNSTQTAGYVN